MTCVSGTFLPSDHSILGGDYILDIPPAPLPPYGALLDFEGQSANGNWTLFAEERDGDQGGIINSWTLTIITMRKVVRIRQKLQRQHYQILQKVGYTTKRYKLPAAHHRIPGR